MLQGKDTTITQMKKSIAAYKQIADEIERVGGMSVVEDQIRKAKLKEQSVATLLRQLDQTMVSPVLNMLRVGFDLVLTQLHEVQGTLRHASHESPLHSRGLQSLPEWAEQLWSVCWPCGSERGSECAGRLVGKALGQPQQSACL